MMVMERRRGEDEMSWETGAYRLFHAKPTEEEIARAKREIAEEMNDAIVASRYIIKPFGTSGEWSIACKIILEGNVPNHQQDIPGTDGKEGCRDQHRRRRKV
mgnify:CR=1 FL=1